MPADLTEGTVIGGRYTLVAPIGAGRHTRVWRVTGPDGAPLAARILDPLLAARDPELARSFREDAAARRGLGEVPGLWPILDAGEDPDLRTPWVVMPLAARSLDDVVTAEGPRPRAEALRLLHDLGCGLDALHGRGLVHGNLHCANILQSQAGSFGITDGHLREDDRRTRVRGRGEAAERPWRYLAPELAGYGVPREPTPAGDVYAVGVIAARALTGRLPFGGRFPAILTEHAESERPDLSAVRPDLGRGVARLVRRMLAPAPGSRPHDGSELRREIPSARTADAPRAAWERALVGVLALLVLLATGVTAARILRTTVTVDTIPSGATVTLIPLAGNGATPAVTLVTPDTLRGLEPGRYRLVAEHPGHASLVREVLIGDRATHLDDLVLEPGSTLELDTDPPGGLITIREEGRSEPVLSARAPIRREGWPRRRYHVEAAGPRDTVRGEWVLDVQAEVERHTLVLAPRLGAVEVESFPPGARVIVDGREVGRTPLRVAGLRRGRHEVEVRADGHLGVQRVVDLDPKAGPQSVAGAEPMRIEVVLPFAGGRRRLEITSTPHGAEVLIAGERLGRTPLTLDLFPVGRTHLQLQHPGRKPWARWIDIPREGTQVKVTLPQ